MKITARLRFFIYFIAGCCLVGYFLLGAIDAYAQTPSRPAMPNSQGFTGGETVSAPNQATPPPQQTSMPVPDSIVDQAKEQNEGNFGPLVRPITAGQIQEVWDYAEPADGVYQPDMCANCTYRIRTRERMPTLIQLPLGERILGIDRGIKAGWLIQQREDNRIVVQPKGFGYDTSMIVRGQSGQVYPFYLRAEGVNSQNIPDLFVKIKGTVQIDDEISVPVSGLKNINSVPNKYGKNIPKVPNMVVPASDKVEDAVDGLVNTNPGTPEDDFVADAKFNPDKLRGWGHYNLWGDDELEPATVFRDDEFTYIKFGDKWKDLELPTAYVVVDGFDELVNTRVQGQTFIVESTQKLITLKSGFKFMCIEYTGA
jgi:ComB9 competence protein